MLPIVSKEQLMAINYNLSGKTVICIVADLAKAIFRSVLLKIGFLVGDAVGVSLHLIVPGQPFI